MGIAADVKDLVKKEPWRAGQGIARNALDPLWSGVDHPMCTATIDDIEWEAKSTWWWCRKCGHGSSAHMQQHRVAQWPQQLYNRAKEHFITKRMKQGLTREQADGQVLHLQAMILKAASELQPSEVQDYVENRVLVK
jgi:hypothetical protein